MPRIWNILLLAICMIGPGRSFAAPGDKHRCDPDYIASELRNSGQFPSLRGCEPNSIKTALGHSDYGLVVESRHSSNSIPPGRIVSQRLSDGTVYVTLSTGPDYPQPGGNDQHNGGGGGLLGPLVAEGLNVLTNLPPPNHQPQVPPTD